MSIDADSQQGGQCRPLRRDMSLTIAISRCKVNR